MELSRERVHRVGDAEFYLQHGLYHLGHSVASESRHERQHGGRVVLQARIRRR